MIGVISSDNERFAVEEFFELFKTQWEFYQPERNRYDVLLVAGRNIPSSPAPLVIVYSSEKMIDNKYLGAESAIEDSNIVVKWGNIRLPVYGKILNFLSDANPILLGNNSDKPVGYETHNGNQRIVRIGYDLFHEVNFLLTTGQPTENAMIPTLDIHISMLRRWIVGSGIDLTEILPSPAGYSSITCLTHDVDFIGIRKHIFDHSTLGFLYRATLQSVMDFYKKRFTFVMLYENLKAACTLPFVYLGICHDPWDQFDNYFNVEGGLPSTFFFIPYKNRSGEGFSKKKEKYRAAKYDLGDVVDIIRNLQEHGCEAGVHGIDAWHSIDKGKKELERLKGISGKEGIGIRMHWLCNNKSTFKILDHAGFSYDSTFGYNDAVGFKAGTSQVYKPFGVKDLLELPLHIQDSALFNRGRMHRKLEDAMQLCDQIIESVDEYKGVITILWHQRSLGPERLWGDFYQMLIERQKIKNIWFANGGDVVDWFRRRRLVRFKSNGQIDVPNRPDEKDKIPGLVVRNYKGKYRDIGRDAHSAFSQFDFEFNDMTI